MPNLLQLLERQIPRSVRRAGEEEIARWLVDEHADQVLEAYDQARLAGVDEHTAVLIACQRFVTHML